MKRNILILISFGLILSACATSQKTAEQKPKEQEIYVFDDANVKNTKDSADVTKQKIVEKEAKDIPTLAGSNYLVQLGAFSTKDKAEKFVSENKSKLTYGTVISYSESVKLFVVQIPGFTTKEEAEKVRNKLWETAVFKDAFIVTLEKK